MFNKDTQTVMEFINVRRCLHLRGQNNGAVKGLNFVSVFNCVPAFLSFFLFL